jgi:hypothetical protein
MQVSRLLGHSRYLSLTIATSCVFIASGHALAIDANNPPPIHIRHRLVNKSALDALKSAREMCLLKGKYGVAVDSSEPDWKNMYIVIEDEYFQGLKYAIYKKSARYKLNPNCSIKIIPSYTADVDDGSTRHIIDLINRKSVSRPSLVVVRKNAQGELSTFARTHPIAAGEIPGALGLEQASQQLKGTSSGTDSVRGEKCDYSSTKQIRDAKVCYWSQSHTYPGPLARPIILKSIVTMGKQENVKEAIIFEVGAPLDRTVFNPKI